MKRLLLYIAAAIYATTSLAQVADLHYGEDWDNESDQRKYYYLTGDVNLWSDLHKRNTSRDTYGRAGLFEGEGSGASTFIYEQDAVDHPYLSFASIEQLNTLWRFERTTEKPPVEVSHNDPWYKLDLKANGAGDLDGHIGRLCGQFKICCGSLETYAFGVGASPDEDWYRDPEHYENYWGNTIHVGQLYTAICSGKANFLPYNSAIDNAVIWFAPRGGNSGNPCEIIITGDPVDLYVYYASTLDDQFDAPQYTHLVISDQINNFPATEPFVNSVKWDNGIEGAGNLGFDYSWERYAGDDGSGVDYSPANGSASHHFPYVWRKRIPSSIIHRTPMGFVVSVTHGYVGDDVTATEATYFPRVRIGCNDLWFIDSEINLFFRFDDPGLMANDAFKVYYNAWNNRYDAESSLVSPHYLSDTFMPMAKSAEGVDEQHSAWEWFKTPTPIPSRFASTGHAMFATSMGGFYPVGGWRGASEDIAMAALHGTDLYYVVGESNDRVELLYSHLKGTFVEGQSDYVQINAEFFIDSPDQWNHRQLNTTLGEGVQYLFSVTDMEGNEIASSQWQREPFFDWDVTQCGSGLYQVLVKVTEHGSIFTASDIYPIFPSSSESL